jgi:hypothetical protein
MSLRRMLRRATSLVIFGICMQFASALVQGGLRAQTAPQASAGSETSAQERQKIAASAIKMPLFFEANEGQTDPSVRFLTRSGGYTMFLTPNETVLVEGTSGIVSGGKFGKGPTAFHADAKNSKQSVLRMELLGANSAPEFQGLQELPGKVNYLIGKNEAAWHTNVALFSEVQVAKVYPGVDLLFHGDQRQLEYDFVVAPGADPGRIGFKICGAKKIEIAANGNLILHTADSEFEMRKPMIYQGGGASRSEVQGRFELNAKNEVRFELGPYDHAEKLVIDPAIDYATFLGGAGEETSEALAVDSSTPGAPKIYTTGSTTDITSFPEGGTRINNPTATNNLYVSEIDPTKTGSASLVYLTFIGGSTAFQSSGLKTCGTVAVWVALDESHQGGAPVEPVVGGETSCADYPGSFITLNVTGTGANALAALVTRLASTGTSIDKSVLLGGNGKMSQAYVFVDATGNVLASGESAATNLPTTTGAYVSTFNNGATGAFDDCYTAKLQRSDLTPVYFSYLNVGAGSTGPGGPAAAQEGVCGGVIDSNNPNILYIGGNTFSTVAFAGVSPSVMGFQPTFQGTEDAFLLKLDSSVSGLAALQYATYIGGGGKTQVNTGAHQLGTGMAVLAGFTTSNSTTNAPDIPLGNSLPGGGVNAAEATGGQTGFLTVMDTTKSDTASLISGSYFGGNSGNDGIRALGYDALIPNGFYIVVGGQTGSTNFPTSHPFQAALSGTNDGFIAAFFITPTTAVTEFSSYIGAGTDDEVTGVDIDSNHAIYATATTGDGSFFGNTIPATTINGFQTTCASCATVGAPAPDATVFALTSAASATFSAQIIATATTLAVGSTEQLNVLATYNDGTFQDLTDKVAWSSSNPTAATVSSSGLVTAGTGGGLTTTISATFPGTTIASVTITVGSATADTFELELVGTAFGTVVDNATPHQINCTNANGQGGVGSSCDTTYANGSVVTFTEQASPGSVFVGWSGAVTSTQCPATSTTCALTVNENPEELIATFNLGTGTPALTVTPAGSGATGGGTVTGTIGGTGTIIDCVMNGTSTTGTCAQTLTQSGQLNTLTAEANSTSNFGGWTGPCVFITSLNKCVVAMNGTQTVSALFTAQTSSFTVALTGNGTITSTSTPTIATEINCANPAPPSACSTNFASGTSVSLRATPGTGYSFTNWTAGPCNASAVNPCVFTVSSTSLTSATALFTTAVVVPPTLTMTKTHVGGFIQGQVGATYTVVVSNAVGAGPTTGTVTVADTIPSGLMLDSMAGTGWACSENTCTRTDALAGGSSYPPITVTVNVSMEATSPQINSVTATGGGSASATATDPTNIVTSVGSQVIVADLAASTDYELGYDDKQRIDGKTPPLQVVLTNTSPTQAVTFTGVSADNAAYTVGMNCTTLAPGQSCDVTASFTTTSACQNQFTHITVVDSDPGGNLVLPINGFGADAAIQVNDLTSSALTPTALAQSLVGAGVTISNVTYTGSARAAGNFTSATNILGFQSGVVLSTGSVRNVVGPNCVSGSARAENDGDQTGISVDNVRPGDTDLATLADVDITNDAAVLEFDFVPTSPSVSFQYVFASDEYNEFVGQINDVFGFFLTALPSGTPVNIALIPGTNLPVAINNVNSGTNPQFYINNEFLPSAAPLDTEMNGLTTTLTAQAQVIPGQTYHIKLAIADAEDNVYDSNVFIQAGSLTSAVVTAFPATLAFGGQAQGTTSSPLPVTVTNVGTATVTITSIVASTNYTEANACPATLVAGTGTGSSCTVNVSFAPTAAGALPGTLTVTYTSAGSASPQTAVVSLTGTGTAATGGTITIVPTSLTFGSQAVGSTSATQTVTVNNTGNTTVTFTSIAMSGDFAGATLAQCPSIGADAAPCTFQISFKPTAAGTRPGAITFTDNATGSPQTVTLTGTGTGGTATVTVTPSSLAFGSQAVSTTSAPLSVTVTNTGTGAVNFGGFTITGTNAGDFAVPAGTSGGACSATGTLAAGASCTIGVLFTPGANGARTATLNIADSATGSPQMVALSGTGGTSSVIITVAPGGSTTATTVSGGTAYYGLMITGAPGITGTVQLGCVPNSALITCKVIPGSVSLNGSAVEVAFAIQTFCQGATTSNGFVPPVIGIGGGLGAGIGLLLVSMMLGGAVWTFRRNRRVALTFATLLLVALGSAACNSLPSGPNGATPAGTYSLSLTTSLNGGPPQTMSNFLTLVVK